MKTKLILSVLMMTGLSAMAEGRYVCASVEKNMSFEIEIQKNKDLKYLSDSLNHAASAVIFAEVGNTFGKSPNNPFAQNEYVYLRIERTAAGLIDEQYLLVSEDIVTGQGPEGILMERMTGPDLNVVSVDYICRAK